MTITDKETEVSENEFYGCSNLKNVRIGNGVTTIGNWAFSGCASLDFFSFGSSVQTIGMEAFSDCTTMTRLISHAANPPVCGRQALDDINKWNCQLSVPEGSLSAYQAADQWKEFFFVDEKAGEEGIEDNPETPGSQKCATPTIAYDHGGLVFECETEGVTFTSEVTTSSAKSSEGKFVILTPPAYTITVVAKKEGFADSDAATATIQWGDGRPVFTGFSSVAIDTKGASDVNGDGTVDVADIATIISTMAARARMQKTGTQSDLF